VSVVYGAGNARVVALATADLAIDPGERVALWGRSGSGKTTLLHLLGGLLRPSAGTVEWEGRPLVTLDGGARPRTRASGIAYVFQGSNLMPHFTAFENVAFAARVAGDVPDPALTPLALLEVVGLAAKADSLPSELSGGEAQRVAIALALAKRPRLLLCDEPTGHLDSDTGSRVLALIDALQRELEFALVLATHDVDVAARLEREVELEDGRVVRTEVHA
jgi:ABC-type lipoprotein export system ATPase subunit